MLQVVLDPYWRLNAITHPPTAEFPATNNPAFQTGFCLKARTLCLVHTKLVCKTSLHVPTQITERVKTDSFDKMFCVIWYQYVSKQFSVHQSRLYSVRGPLVSSSDRLKSPVHLVGTTFPNSPSPSAVRWNPFRPSCTSFPLRPIPFYLVPNSTTPFPNSSLRPHHVLSTCRT